jgi:alpha-glucosidase
MSFNYLIFTLNINVLQNIIKYWLRKGIDGFCVHAVSHLFEHVAYSDEPLSYEPKVLAQDYKYLNHTYTRDDSRSYKLLLHWRNIMDNYADQNNEDEKVSVTHFYYDFSYCFPFITIYIVKIK